MNTIKEVISAIINKEYGEAPKFGVLLNRDTGNYFATPDNGSLLIKNNESYIATVYTETA